MRECLCLPRQYVLIDSIDKSSSHQAGVDSIVGKVRWHQRLYAVDSVSRCVHCLPDLRLPMSMIYSTPSTFIPLHSPPSTTFINSVCLFTQHRFTPLLPSDHCLVKNSSTTLFTFTVSVTQVDRFITNYLEISDNFILIPFHSVAWYSSSLLQHFISVSLFSNIILLPHVRLLLINQQSQRNGKNTSECSITARTNWWSCHNFIWNKSFKRIHYTQRLDVLVVLYKHFSLQVHTTYFFYFSLSKIIKLPSRLTKNTTIQQKRSRDLKQKSTHSFASSHPPHRLWCRRDTPWSDALPHTLWNWS